MSVQFLRGQTVAHRVHDDVHALESRVAVLRKGFLHTLPAHAGEASAMRLTPLTQLTHAGTTAGMPCLRLARIPQRGQTCNRPLPPGGCEGILLQPRWWFYSASWFLGWRWL